MPRDIVFDIDEVLDKVVQLFWEKGYAATSMQDLTEATGLNRSSIYNTFGSKITLYKLALKTYQKRAGGLFQRALVKSTNPLEAIKLIFDAMIGEIVAEGGRKGCFNMNCKAEMAQKDNSIKVWLEQTQENSLSLFEGLVIEAQELGMINKNQKPTQYAQYLYSAFQGMRMTGILISDEKVLKDIAQTTLSVLE